MGTLIDKLSLKTGRDSSNKFDLSCFHGTTAKFYQPRITYFHEFVPGEKWNMDARCSVTCMPMIKPLMGDIKVHNRFFFVPYYSIFNKWNEFIAESPVVNPDSPQQLIHPEVPFIDEYTLVDALRSHYADFASNAPTEYEDVGEGYDFQYEGVKYVLNEKGRTIYNILLGLGYNVNLVLTSMDNHSSKLSMLPLLAYLKVFLDWYNNTAFDTYTHIEQYFEKTGGFSSNDFVVIADVICKIYLEKDYFTSATLYPVGTNSSTMQLSHRILDPTYSYSSSNSYLNTISSPSDSGANGTPLVVQSSPSNTATISKFSLDAVNALTDYVKRHQLAGIQPFNRILAEYGVTLTDEELRRSTFIGDAVMDVDVKTVVSNGYADDTTLGERAGLGSGGRQQHFDYRNENFGAIICVTTIVPRLSYVDGIKRHCLRTERFDFFTPSVEHLGTEPILTKELFNNYVKPSVGQVTKDSIFGFMPRYAAYKTALDSLSGDFMLHSRRMELDPWILRRDLHPYEAFGDVATMSRSFTLGDNSKVNNLFVDEESDQFIIFNMYHVSAILPMHKLFDDYQWSNENDNPKEVTIHNQGVQMS